MVDEVLDGLEVELLGKRFGQFIFGDDPHFLQDDAEALFFLFLPLQRPFEGFLADDFSLNQNVAQMFHPPLSLPSFKIIDILCTT